MTKRCFLCRRVKERYPFIKARRDEYPVRMLGRALGVHSGGYYVWLHQPRSDREIEGSRLTGKIKQYWLESGGYSGYRNIHEDLLDSAP